MRQPDPAVLSERCSTCVFRPGNLMHLRPGRLRELASPDRHLTCHQTLSWVDGTVGEAMCRGYYDAVGERNGLIRIINRLGGFRQQPPPTKETPVTLPLPLSEPVPLRHYPAHLGIPDNAEQAVVGELVLIVVHVGNRQFRWWVLNHPTDEWAVGDDLHSPAGAPIPDNATMLGVLATFLRADAERYAGSGRLGAAEPNEPYLFGPEVAAWAYDQDAELSVYLIEVDERERHPEG